MAKPVRAENFSNIKILHMKEILCEVSTCSVIPYFTAFDFTCFDSV